VCSTPHYVPFRVIDKAVDGSGINGIGSGVAPISPVLVPPASLMDYSLQIFRENAPSQTVNLREGKNIIGRRNCDVVIPDTTISRRHCVIEIRKDSRSNWQCLLYDIGYLEGTESTNGVFVDGRSQRLNNREQHIFHVGDRSQIGKTIIQLDSKNK
jgi:hypothetical protein